MSDCHLFFNYVFTVYIFDISLAQLIQTIPNTSQNRSRQGLFAEIEDIEARSEEYPLTRAMLKLIDTLTVS